MDTQRWQRIAAIFDEVIEAPPETRAEVLARCCAGDAGLQREIEALLIADAAGNRFERGVDSARASAAFEWTRHSDEESTKADERIGPWQVLHELGRGGMGVVLLAERADGQFEQRAALKLIKRGMDSEAVIARFLRERQILAQLEHPHIARLLDGGLAADGRPYFAMELVDGRPLLRYCAERNLKLEDRLSIFLDICAAVQFAHGRLIVHRDLKPTNVLVATDGSVKLLDFGIAKLLADDDAGPATATGHERPLTLAYAAPEQVRGEPVTIAADIYALGCVLYEMLTGARPFDFADAPNAEDVVRAFDTSRPVAPSKRRSSGAAVAARRLRGDLDTIVLKALQHEPQRRYATAAALADDLQRFLGGRPIAARRDSAMYRAQKFVVRHRIGVAATAAFGLALCVSTGMAIWQARAKTREAQASAEVTQFLIGLFRGADPAVSRGAGTTAQDLVDLGAERLRADTRMVPALRARLLTTVAATYTALGIYERALPLAQQSLELRRSGSPQNDADLADSLYELGHILRLTADYGKAEPMLREALALRRHALAPTDPAIIESLREVGALLRARGEFGQADVSLAEALRLAQQGFGMDATETAQAEDDYAANLDDLGQRNDAIEGYRHALAIREKRLGPDDPEVAGSLIDLGVHLDEAGDYARALPLLERALAIRRKIFGDAHPLTGIAELALAGVYESLDRNEECERLAVDALAIFQRTLPEDHPRIIESLNMLAIVRTGRRDYAGAVPLAREVLRRFERTSGKSHPDTLTAENNLAYALSRSGELAEAEALFREAIGLAGNDNGGLTLAYENLANTLDMQGKTAEAVTMAKHALSDQKSREGAESGNVAVALRVLASAEAMNGDGVAAERDYREALQMGQRLATRQSVGIYPWRVALADFLAGQGRCDEALPLLQIALAEIAAVSGGADPTFEPEAQLLRGHCLSGAERVESAKLIVAAKQSLRAIPAVEVDLYPTARSLLAAAPSVPASQRTSAH